MGNIIEDRAHQAAIDKSLREEDEQNLRNTKRHLEEAKDRLVKATELDPAKAVTTHPSGATSSHLAPVFTNCVNFLFRFAQRCALGDRDHGRGNWIQAIYPRLDLSFCRDRYNHAVEHLLKLSQEGTKKDDHIGAVAWFLGFATEVEAAGYDWKEILVVRTPSGEEYYRKELANVHPPSTTPK